MEKMQEHCLRLIFSLMCGGDRVGAGLERGLPQQTVSLSASRFFNSQVRMML